MTRSTAFLLTSTLLLTIIGCGQSHQQRDADDNTEMSAPAPAPAMSGDMASGTRTTTTMNYLATDSMTAPSTAISSSAAVETGRDSTHRFIRTADIRFKARSVVNTTYKIEEIVNQVGGFVSNTNLTSTINKTDVTAISADSSLETTYYSVENSMTLRVPNTKLDTTLKMIAPLIDYLDYRRIQANDVALSMLSNRMTQARVGRHAARLQNEIDSRGKKLAETTTAEENLLSKQEQADDAFIDNLTLEDQIKFSTITMLIYQHPGIRREVIANEKNIEGYEPGFGSKLLEGLKIGWNTLATFFVFLAKLWGPILFVIIALVLYRTYRHKFNNK